MNRNYLGADLRGVKWSGCDYRECDFGGAKLNGASLQFAHLSGSTFTSADLSDANLFRTRLDEADLRYCRGLRLDETFIRGAQFSRVMPRGHAFLNRLLGRQTADSDPWSVLRQLYSGPRTLFLFFFVVVFALPYVARAAFYSTASAAEQRVIDAWERRMAPHRAVAGPAAEFVNLDPTPSHVPPFASR